MLISDSVFPCLTLNKNSYTTGNTGNFTEATWLKEASWKRFITSTLGGFPEGFNIQSQGGIHGREEVWVFWNMGGVQLWKASCMQTQLEYRGHEVMVLL